MPTETNGRPNSVDRALEIVATSPFITVQEVMERVQDLTFADVWTMIDRALVYVDLSGAPFTMPDRVEMFPTAEALQAAKIGKLTTVTNTFTGLIRNQPGVRVLIATVAHTIKAVTDTHFEFVTDDGKTVRMTTERFAAAMANNQVECVQQGSHQDVLYRTVLGHSPAAQKKAAERWAMIADRVEPWFASPGPKGPPPGISSRHMRRIEKGYRDSKRRFGIGYVGLMPKENLGNRDPKVPAEVLRIFEETIRRYYRSSIKPQASSIYAQFTIDCEAAGLRAFSEKTFYTRLGKLDRHDLETIRSGEKVALKFEEPHWQLEYATPVHGDYPWQVGHMDFTPADYICRCPLTGLEIRPMICSLLDAFTRRVLAVHVSFDKGETVRAAFATLRACVRRHGRLPRRLVMDNGSAFKAADMETFCGLYELVKVARPPGLARFGAPLERFFGTTTTELLHQLPGNTQSRRDIRQSTPAVDPAGRDDLMTPAQFVAVLSNYCYEIYDSSPHTTLGMSPRAFEAACVAKHGGRVQAYVAYSTAFRVATMTSSRRATVSERSGVRAGNFDYWCEEFTAPGVPGTKVDVKIDDWDLSIAYAWVRDRWVACQCHRARDLQHLNDEKRIERSTTIRRLIRETRSTGTLERRIKVRQLVAKVDGLEEMLLEHASRQAREISESLPRAGEAPLPIGATLPTSECPENTSGADAPESVPANSNDGTTNTNERKDDQRRYTAGREE